MDTIKRARELATERNMSLRQLADLCQVPYSTLKNAENRGGQLSVDTIELICTGLQIPMMQYFDETGWFKTHQYFPETES